MSTTIAIDEEFICGICLELMISPTCCVEGHSWCKSCIDDWLRKTQTCPVDREALTSSTLTRNRPLEKMIAKKLDVACQLKPQGCDWVGHCRLYLEHSSCCDYRVVPCEYCAVSVEARNMVQHEQSCEQFPVKCNLVGCDWKGVRREFKEHISHCVHRRVCCDACKESIVFRSLEKHHTSLCPCRLLLCEYCAVSVEARNMVEHVEQSCNDVPIPCPYASIGCNVMFSRSQLAQHSSDMTVHFLVLMNKLSQQSLQINEQSQQITKQSQQIDEQSQEITKQSQQIDEQSQEISKQSQQILFLSNYRNSNGMTFHRNGSMEYEGGWIQGNYHGHGILYYKDGSLKFKGEWEHGHRRHGASYRENGSVEYEGGWREVGCGPGAPDYRHGNGKSFHENGSVEYEGGWIQGKYSDHGVLYYKDGSIEFKGEWECGDRRHGTSYRENGSIYYEGEWMISPHGYGTSYNEDGSIKFKGHWVNGQISGMSY